jgi:hypothetical protein
MWLIDFVAKTFFFTRFKVLMKAVDAPQSAQEKTLHYLIQKGKNTAYGKQNHFSNIRNYADFARMVPVVEYPDLYPYIERMLHGEQNVLWPSIKQFSRSSGTTSGKSKFIPVSREGLVDSHIATGKHFLSTYLQQHPESGFFRGKGIVLTGSYYPYSFPENPEIADVSAILYRFTDSWINYFKALPITVALMDDWEEKLEAIAQTSIPQNVTNISGVPTWMLLLFRTVLAKTGKQTIAEVWPNLELVIHGGVDFAPYRLQFEEVIGKPVVYRNVYNSSEGFFAFQNDDDGAMLLDLANGVFYEFEEEKSATVVPLQRVQLGKRYAIIVSTNSGLWRYKIGDVVEFSSVSPFKFSIVGRTSQYLNAFGEELIQANTDAAIAEVATAFKVNVIDYTVAPSFIANNQKGFHEWLVEFEVPPADMLLFAHRLDEALQNLNSDYEAKRFKDLALKQLQIVVGAQGVFARWLKENNRLGVQAKIPRLSNTRLVIEQIKTLN